MLPHRPIVCSSLLLLGLGLSACGDVRRTETLADLGGYDGGIEILIRIGEQERRIAGSLVFDRAAGRLRFEGTVDGRPWTLVREGERPPMGIDASGAEVPLGLQEEGTAALLLALIHAEPDRDADVEGRDDGYRITSGSQVIDVTWRAPR